MRIGNVCGSFVQYLQNHLSSLQKAAQHGGRNCSGENNGVAVTGFMGENAQDPTSLPGAGFISSPPRSGLTRSKTVKTIGLYPAGDHILKQGACM